MASSSKRKSSKKKSSKISSQPRRMKKSRKSKSKKLGRRYDSSDDSTSSQSISSPSDDLHSSKSVNDSMSSSYEDSYKSRKKVSRLRSNTKSTRKRARRRLRSRESSEDLSHIKKRKRSRKNADSKSRNKLRKKKPRRDMSTSSASSTCKGGSSNCSEESELQRLRISSTENKKDKQVSRKERIGSKKRTHRSPSCSSYSRSRDQSCSVSRGDEKFMCDPKSKRLRSIITVPEQFHEKEGNKLEKDPLKEEMVYDRDDYPSSRSNDSGGGGSQRELISLSPVASDDKRQENNIKGEETFACNRLTEPSESRKDVHDQNAHDPSLNKVETSKSEKETGAGAHLTGAGFGGDDLESTLRQKALENLRKFRGGLQTSVKTTANQHNKDDGDNNQSATARVEIVKRGLLKQDNSNAIGSVQMLNRSVRRTLKGEVSCSTRAVRDISDGGYTGKRSGSVEQNISHPPEGLVLSGNPLKEDHTQSVVVNSEPGNSLLRDQSTGTNSTLNQTMITQASPDENLTENKESEGKNSPKITQLMPPGVTDNQATGVHTASCPATVNLASSFQSTSGGQGLNDHRDEAKDGSQFEQKTMSVVRGGEMVQVNYKVYIPKRAPALSRRQLKR